MAAGAYILAPAASELTASEADFFREADPWGFILFARNVETPDQVRALTAGLRDTLGRDAPIFIDQEGGRVQRLGAPHWREWAPPLEDAMLAGDQAVQAFALRYRIIAEELRQVGIDGNCVPCADLASDATHPFLQNRCYGSDVETVVKLATVAAAGTLHGGVLPVIKHLPGHGRATVDSHGEMPRVTTPRDELLRSDFAIFRGLANQPLGMTGHLIFEDIDDQPSTLSPPVIDLIRTEIGFTGLLMTDDISMGALTGPMDERCRASIAAGCDLVLHCNGDLGEMEAVVSATGRLSGAAENRATTALAARSEAAPGDFDIDAAVAMFEQIVKGRANA